MKLIAESGSTKTMWGLLDKSDLVFQYTSIGLNPWIVESSTLSLELERLQLKLSDTYNNVTEVYFFGAGCSTIGSKQIISNALLRVFKNAEIVVKSDLLGAAIGLFGDSPGIVAILGTGSNVAYYDGKKLDQKVLSSGYVLGDEGSGNHLGRSLIQLYTHNKLSDKLKKEFEDTFCPNGFSDILSNIYKKPFPNKYLASFAPFVFSYKDDPVIEEMINNCFTSFVTKYILPHAVNDDCLVGFVGSVSSFFRESLLSIFLNNGLKINKFVITPFDALISYYAENQQ